ncbi:MAG TPA: hypothetical protein VGX71_07945 [Pseudaminobacter sp.]|nr:hypothetical protein [Pseudaminobacter sp.]
MAFSLSPGQSLDDVKFSAMDGDYDLLSFIVVDGPNNGTLEQETRFDGDHYPFHQGHYGTSLHHHADFLSGNLFDYTPEAGFVGTDSFTVYATDGQGNSNVARITITVTPPAESIALTDAKDIARYGSYDHAVLVAALGGNDRISGTPFDDTLDGGAGRDQLFGGAGADTIVGGAGADRIRGDTGDDILNGGAGRDRSAGGAGSDVFVFDALGRANCDSIEDFNPLDDVFRLDSSAFVGLSAGPLSAAAFVVAQHSLDDSDHIIYDVETGDLRFDVDGAGGAEAVKFAAVDPGTLLTADDFFVLEIAEGVAGLAGSHRATTRALRIIFEFLSIMRSAPILPRPLRPLQRLLIRAAIDLLPADLCDQLDLGHLRLSPPQQARVLVRRYGNDRTKLMEEASCSGMNKAAVPNDNLSGSCDRYSDQINAASWASP